VIATSKRNGSIAIDENPLYFFVLKSSMVSIQKERSMMGRWILIYNGWMDEWMDGFFEIN
jgi:hypothetical protein